MTKYNKTPATVIMDNSVSLVFVSSDGRHYQFRIKEHHTLMKVDKYLRKVKYPNQTFTIVDTNGNVLDLHTPICNLLNMERLCKDLVNDIVFVNIENTQPCVYSPDVKENALRRPCIEFLCHDIFCRVIAANINLDKMFDIVRKKRRWGGSEIVTFVSKECSLIQFNSEKKAREYVQYILIEKK